MEKAFAYICAAQDAAPRLLRRYCHKVYELGYVPICPKLSLPQYLSADVPEEQRAMSQISQQLLRRCRMLVVCGNEISTCALPGFVDSKNEEKTERNAGYLVVSHSGGGMLRQGTRKGIRRTPANRGMRAHRIVKSLDISEDVCHGLCP